jgi:hypothetical protein
MSSRFGTYVDPTGESHREVLQRKWQHFEQKRPTDKDSEIDENVEIVEMEKRDFNDVEGIESDIE